MINLDYKERLGYHSDQISPWNIQAVFKSNQKIERSKFESSLLAIQNAHPRLQVYIAKHLGIPRFFCYLIRRERCFGT